MKANNLSWAAIAIAIFALMLSFFALNQSSNLKLINSKNLQSQVRSLQQQAQLRTASEKLEDLKQRATVGGAAFVSQAQVDVTQIREDLRKNFETASENTKKSWQELDKQLVALQDNLRSGGVNVIDAIDKVLQNLKKNIQHD